MMLRLMAACCFSCRLPGHQQRWGDGLDCDGGRRRGEEEEGEANQRKRKRRRTNKRRRGSREEEEQSGFGKQGTGVEWGRRSRVDEEEESGGGRRRVEEKSRINH